VEENINLKKKTWTEYIAENGTVDGTRSVREGKGCNDGFTYKCVCTSGSDTGSISSSGN
jgi:hypothetical protein